MPDNMPNSNLIPIPIRRFEHPSGAIQIAYSEREMDIVNRFNRTPSIYEENNESSS